jgi:hypothetical protein
MARPCHTPVSQRDHDDRDPVSAAGLSHLQGGLHEKVPGHLRDEFPHLVSYQRFIELPLRVLVPLIVCLHTRLGAFPMSASSASPATSAERPKWPSNEAIT